MGVVYDPALYRADEKRFAPYKFPEYVKAPWQTWHTDFVFDNGWSGTMMLSFTGPMRCVLLNLLAPDGKLTETIQFIDEEDVIIDENGYDIQMGPDNYFRAKFPILKMHADDKANNCGLDLTVETLIEPTISELPDGIGIGRINTPNMPVSVAWYYMPWNKITGTLKVDGKTFPVNGYGWSDHQFGTADFFGDACHYFYWGNFPIGGNSGENLITIFEAQGGPHQGYRPIKWVWNFKDGKVYSYDRDADFYIYCEDIPEGDTVPHTLKYVFEGDRIRGVIEGKWLRTMMKQAVDQLPFHAILNRSLYDCHAEMEIDGEKIVTDFTRILEACYSYDPTEGQRLAYRGEVAVASAAEAAPEPAEEAAPEAAPEPEYVDDGRPPKFTMSSKLGEVMADPRGVAVMEKYLPGISKDPNTSKGYGMKLKILFAMPATGVDKKTRALMDADLRKIKD
ncbi:MAG: hypothetical protein IJH75_05590 [Mogibacterium sp.]|nr:hypothetical protein [Mogibacterium sp.]